MNGDSERSISEGICEESSDEMMTMVLNKKKLIPTLSIELISRKKCVLILT